VAAQPTRARPDRVERLVERKLKQLTVFLLVFEEILNSRDIGLARKVDEGRLWRITSY